MFNILVFALLLVMTGTSNGRRLIIQTFRKTIERVPFCIRRTLSCYSYLLPLFIVRPLTFMVSCPLGSDHEWIHIVKQKDWKGIWVVPGLKDTKQAEELAPQQDLIILYTHGGGFSLGYSSMYMETFRMIIQQLAKEYNIQASILSVEYSLSPENAWPSACNETLKSYRYLIHELGISPSKVILAGDSAGGNLVATTLLKLKELKSDQSAVRLPPLPMPAGAAFLSPWVNLTKDQQFPKVNDTVSPKLLDFYVDNYAKNEADLVNPMVSPVFGDFSGIRCPMFLAYGSEEVLRDSIVKFSQTLENNGCDITILRGLDTTHIWLVYSLMSTSRQTFERDCSTLIRWLAKTTIGSA